MPHTYTHTRTTDYHAVRVLSAWTTEGVEVSVHVCVCVCVCRVLVMGWDVLDAVSVPRVHHQLLPFFTR